MPNTKLGFTLVELAIVIVIIGLLVAGVLGGQELIRVSELNGIVKEIKAIEAAAIMYKDKYNRIPGDDISALSKFPNCADQGVCTNGNNDMVVTMTDTPFAHMAAANLIKNKRCLIPSTSTQDRYASVSKSFCYGFWGPSAYSIWGVRGIYIRSVSTGGGILTPMDAHYIDAKLDDGAASMGNFLTVGNEYAPSTKCLDNNDYLALGAGAGKYNLGSEEKDCIVHYFMNKLM